MEQIVIENETCLTNEFILNINDNLFIKTTAFNIFGNKVTFTNKINDKNLRYKMLKNILFI